NAWHFVRLCSGERVGPRIATECEQGVQRRLCEGVAEGRQIDRVVPVAPADAQRAAVRREDPEAGHGSITAGNATLTAAGLRTVGACEPRQIREEAALSIPSQVCGQPGISCLNWRARGGHPFVLESTHGRPLPEIPPAELRRGRRTGG